MEVGPTLALSAYGLFTIHTRASDVGQVLIKKYELKTLFLLVNLQETENGFYSTPPPLPADQANPFAFNCSFALQILNNIYIFKASL